jgi:hypothetical protein
LSFCENFLKLKESICIGLGFGALIGACFHGVTNSALYGPCIKRHFYRRLNN